MTSDGFKSSCSLHTPPTPATRPSQPPSRNPSMAASSSRGRSSSPFGFRKHSSPYSSASSSSSLTGGGRLIPRSCSSSASSHFYGSGNGLSARSVTPNRYRGDSGPHLGHKAPVSRSPIGFASAEELGGEVEALKPGGESISVTVRFRPLR